MTRVLLDCRMAKWSGIGRYTTGLVRALSARDDLELTQVCAPRQEPPIAEGSLAKSVTSSSHPFSVRGALELGRIVRKTAPDLVHCLHFPTPIPLETPLVVTLHDLIPLVVPGSMPALHKRLAYRLWNARATNVADSIIVPSQATAEEVARLFPLAQDKLVVTPEAADDFSAGPVGPLGAALADLTTTPYLLAMGVDRTHKDVPTLLRAFSILAPAFPGLRLLLVGPAIPGLLQGLPAAAHDIATRVHFTGRIEDTELRALYAGAAVFICPSLHEGFGLPLLEAMAMGAPAVGADASSLPEVAGEAALLFPAGDHQALAATVTRVLQDPESRKSLSAASLHQAAQFSWAKTAAATAAVYAAVLQAREMSPLGWEGDQT